MTAKLVSTVSLVLTLLVVQTRAVEENYALNGLSYQFDSIDDGCSLPSKAVDGSALQDANACQCAQTGSLLYLPYRPWWVVKLRRWVQVSSFRVIGTQTPNEARDSGYSFLLGAFWNDSLPSIVPWNALTSDPIKRQGFTRLSQQNGSLHDFPNANAAFNATSRGVGRYFAVQSPSQLVMLCEVQVFGKESVLSGIRKAWSIVSDNPLYQLYNLSVLTDDREDTCLQLGSAKDGRVVVFQSVSPVPGHLSFILLSKGGLQGQNYRECQSGVSLRVVMRHSKNGAWVEDPTGRMAQVQSYSDQTMHRFECDCIDCQPMLFFEIGWEGAGVSQPIEICETFVFPSTLPATDASASNSDVSGGPDCDASGKYCCPKQQVYSVKYALWPVGDYITFPQIPILGYQMSFTKAFTSTDLRLILCAEVRCLSGCCRVYLTYNGIECLDPAPNELILKSDPSNIHWTGNIEGICRGIPAGNVIIKLNAAACEATAGTIFSMGRTGTIRFIVEEAEPPKNDSTPSCLHATAFNTRQYILNTTTDADIGTIFTANYNKSAAETALKLTFDGTAKVAGACGGASECCGSWQFLINGLACNNPGPIVGMISQTSAGNPQCHMPVVFSGVCYGIPAGPLVVSVALGTCVGYTTTADLYTGLYSASHILIEEIRENIPFITAMTTPTFNLQNYYLNLSSDADTGLLASVNYLKTRSDTALRVLWSSNNKLSAPSPGVDYRNEWHVLFNGQECTNPGKINFVFLINAVGNGMSSSRTGRTFGMCLGIPAGNVGVSLQAVFTGWGSDVMGDIMTTGGVRVSIDEVLLTS